MGEPRLYKSLSQIVKYYVRLDTLNEWNRNGHEPYEIQEMDMKRDYPKLSASDHQTICELTKVKSEIRLFTDPQSQSTYPHNHRHKALSAIAL